MSRCLLWTTAYLWWLCKNVIKIKTFRFDSGLSQSKAAGFQSRKCDIREFLRDLGNPGICAFENPLLGSHKKVILIFLFL